MNLRTLLLGLAALGLVGLDLALRLSDEVVVDAERRLPAFELSEVVRLELEGGGLELLVLARDAEGWWRITSLGGAPARAGMVIALLDHVRHGVVVEGEGPSDALGESPRRVRVHGERGVLLDLLVGDNVPGGSTFVRMAHHEDVLRVRIGGRGRYRLPAADWRDLHLVREHPDQVLSVGIVGLQPALVQPDGGWRVPGRAAVTALATLQGWAAVPAGQLTDAQQLGALELSMRRGERIQVWVYQRGTQILARRADRPEVFALASNPLEWIR
jgi:hypothetical protein